MQAAWNPQRAHDLAVILAIAVISAVAVTSTANAENEPMGSRRDAAKRYLAVVPVTAMVAESIKQLSRRVPEAERPRFIEFVSASMPQDMISEAAVDALVKIFSVRELDAMTRFYQSDDGQSILKKLPAYAAEVMPTLQRELIQAVAKFDEGRVRSP